MIQLQVFQVSFPPFAGRPAVEKRLVTARLLEPGEDQRTYHVFGFHDLDCFKRRIGEVAGQPGAVRRCHAVLNEISCGTFTTGEDEDGDGADAPSTTMVDDFLYKRKPDTDCCRSFYEAGDTRPGWRMAAFLSVVRHVSLQNGMKAMKLIDAARAGSADAPKLTPLLLAQGGSAYYSRFGFSYGFSTAALWAIRRLRLAYTNASSGEAKARIVQEMQSLKCLTCRDPVLSLVEPPPPGVSSLEYDAASIPHADWVRAISAADRSVRMPSAPLHLVQFDVTLPVQPAIPDVQPLVRVRVTSPDGSLERSSQLPRLGAALPALVRLRL